MKLKDRIPEKQYREIVGQMPIICVDIVITYNHRILLVKRMQEPEKGKWWLPGGRLLKGEKLEDCALRKAREELELECTVIDYLGYDETTFDTSEFRMPVHTVNFYYLLQASDDKPISDGTWDEHKWIDHNLDDLHPCLKTCLDSAFLYI